MTWEQDRRGLMTILIRSAFDTMYAGTLCGQQVAIKAEVLDESEEEAWLKSAQLHYGATSPHVVAVHGVIVDRNERRTTHHLVMERLAGTMTALLLTPGGTHYGAGMELRLQLLADVACGLAYLHACSVIHGCVTADNVLRRLHHGCHSPPPSWRTLATACSGVWVKVRAPHLWVSAAG